MPFDKLLRHLFCQKVAPSATGELPLLLETLLENADYVGIQSGLSTALKFIEKGNKFDSFSQVFKRAYVRHIKKAGNPELSEMRTVLK